MNCEIIKFFSTLKKTYEKYCINCLQIFTKEKRISIS